MTDTQNRPDTDEVTDDTVIVPEAFAIDDGESGKEWRAVFILQGCKPSTRINVFGNTQEIALERARERAPADCVKVRLFGLTKVADCDGPFVNNPRCQPRVRDEQQAEG
ncbi:hypothetical protein [Pyruvatibacter sp.]